jgi:putative N-acetylmannosamine-6-phosphate epimerase
MARQAQPTGIRIISGTLQGSHSTSEQDKELDTALVALSNLVPFIYRAFLLALAAFT